MTDPSLHALVRSRREAPVRPVSFTPTPCIRCSDRVWLSPGVGMRQVPPPHCNKKKAPRDPSSSCASGSPDLPPHPPAQSCMRSFPGRTRCPPPADARTLSAAMEGPGADPMGLACNAERCVPGGVRAAGALGAEDRRLAAGCRDAACAEGHRWVASAGHPDGCLSSCVRTHPLLPVRGGLRCLEGGRTCDDLASLVIDHPEKQALSCAKPH